MESALTLITILSRLSSLVHSLPHLSHGFDGMHRNLSSDH